MEFLESGLERRCQAIGADAVFIVESFLDPSDEILLRAEEYILHPAVAMAAQIAHQIIIIQRII